MPAQAKRKSRASLASSVAALIVSPRMTHFGTGHLGVDFQAWERDIFTIPAASDEQTLERDDRGRARRRGLVLQPRGKRHASGGSAAKRAELTMYSSY